MPQLLRTSTRPLAPSYDAIVVGAHPAGAAAAMLLAHAAGARCSCTGTA